jgi:hypothetical protein
MPVRKINPEVVEIKIDPVGYLTDITTISICVTSWNDNNEYRPPTRATHNIESLHPGKNVLLCTKRLKKRCRQN